jgi:hypothetical protein
MAPDVQPGNLDFPEAARYFRDKVRLPSDKWTDYMKGQHAQAFVVAGATKAELLKDLHEEIQKAIDTGTGLEEFRAEFDKIVDRHGWSYKGGRNWRTRVIFETNLRTSYQVGRFAQMKEAIALRPFWQYRHGDSLHPRPLHVSWDRLVFRHDDPWWATHYPPNGWGCKCTVMSLAEEDLADQGKSGPDVVPEDGWGPKPDPVTGERVPAGIDPGWDYHPGETAHGKRLSDEAMAEWDERSRADTYERLTPGDWQTEGRPAKIPESPVKANPRPPARTKEEFKAGMRDILGDEKRVFTVGQGDWAQPVAVDAESFADHVDLGRSPFAPFIPEVLEEPFEAWLGFERHRGTGKVELKLTVVKALAAEHRRMVIVAKAKDGQFEGFTMIPMTNEAYVNRQRWGRLIQAAAVEEGPSLPTRRGG